MSRMVVLTLVCLLALGGVEEVSAYSRMVFSQGSSDTFEQAQPFRGEAHLSGEVSGDEHDLFRWILDDTETDQLWRLELQGTEGVRVELFRPGDGATETGVATFGETASFDATSAAPDDEQEVELLTLATSTRAPRQVSEPLIVPTGEHLIRFTTNGDDSEYRLLLTTEDRINIRGTVGPDRADNIVVRPGRQWFFQLNVPEAIIPLEAEGKSQQLWRLNLQGELGVPLEAWVENSIGEVIAEALEGSLQHQWGQLALPEGSVLHLRQTQGEPIGRAAISVAEDGLQPAVTTQTPASEEPEPVDEPPDSKPDQTVWLIANEPMQGRFEHHQEAWFDLLVSGEAQQWAFTTESETPLSRLSLFRAGEQTPFMNLDQARRDPQPLWIENVRLLPGHYRVRLNGEETDFQLLASPQDRPQPGLEIEPNDLDADANPLWLGEPVHGNFYRNDDQDRFHFHLPGWNRVALEVEPPEGGTMSARLEWQGEPRLTMSPVHQPETVSHLLPPGDYVLVLQGERASPKPYRVTLSLVDPWMPQGAVLPVAQRDQAPLLPESGLLTKRFGWHGGYLRLPVSAENREIEFKGRLDATGGTHSTAIELLTVQGQRLEIEEVGTQHYTASIPGGELVWLKASFGRHAPDIVIDDPAYPQPVASPLEVELASNTHRVAAFIAEGQRVSSRLVIKNPEPEVQHIPLATHISHAGGGASGLPNELTLEPDEQIELMLEWDLPPGLLENTAVSLFVRAGDHVAQHHLQPEPEAPAVDPVVVSDVPQSLLGLTDLAWSALGATFVDADSGEPIESLPQQRAGYPHFLIDGIAATGSSIQVSNDLGEALPLLRLAGDGGRVHGFAFNPRSSHAYGNRWRDVEIAMGESHQDLEVVMTVELASTDGEQFFLLDEPRQASYVRLRPLGVWGDPTIRNRHHGTGLLRVLGEPMGELAARRHNLLDRILGGHWVYTLPHLDRLQGLQGERFSFRSTMDERQVRRGESIRGRSVEMVFAFLQQRAARIDRLQWQDNLEWEGVPVERVRVYTATESPIGPWQEQAEWTLERDASGVAELVLPDTPWARYLRLVFDEPEADESRSEQSWRIPSGLAVFEADPLGSGHSILGHWGMDHSRGPLETERISNVQALYHVEDSESHTDAPWELHETVTGRVEEPGDTRHYQIILQEGDNTLSFALEESQRGRLQATLHSPEGREVALSWRDHDSGQRMAEAVDLGPGKYHLSLTEPPRSVVFVWDGSGSVASHQPAIYQALSRFAEGLEPGREVFNMLPLGGPLLIDGWAESPSQVAETLAAYDNRFTGSDSEPALRTATRALEQQPGERAIFLITDAEQVNRDLSVWQDLARVRPRIFALEISHGNRVETELSRWYQHQMLGWSHVGNGHYRYATNRSGLVSAFEEGMRMLRRPTTFSLEVQRRYQEPPEPGSLKVISADPEQPAVAAGAVHLIFDASGSMLRQMEGGRRIEVARRIVQQVLDERIPDSVPVALRAFGHTKPHSCATELLVAPSEDNHAEVRQAVGEIQAVNLARTALADSLDAVLDDLADYAGQRRLAVMLTDGEETCDGDLEQSVQRLVEEGIDVRLNIVGFHIDELGLQAEFERFAELGGGEYFDSHDGDELVEGLVNALAAPWHVIDERGDRVASGRVDDSKAIELDAGSYQLVVETQAGERRRKFNVAPRQSVEITIESE